VVLYSVDIEFVGEKVMHIPAEVLEGAICASRRRAQAIAI
jgi:hypothetical protein